MLRGMSERTHGPQAVGEARYGERFLLHRQEKMSRLPLPGRRIEQMRGADRDDLLRSLRERDPLPPCRVVRAVGEQEPEDAAGVLGRHYGRMLRSGSLVLGLTAAPLCFTFLR